MRYMAKAKGIRAADARLLDDGAMHAAAARHASDAVMRTSEYHHHHHATRYARMMFALFHIRHAMPCRFFATMPRFCPAATPLLRQRGSMPPCYAIFRHAFIR